MKIIFDARAYNNRPSGIGKSVKNILEYLLKDNFHNYTVIYSCKELREKLQAMSCEWIYAPFRIDQHIFSEYWEMSVLVNNIKKGAYDIYFAPSFTLPFGMEGCKKIKKIVIIHDMIVFDHPETMPISFRIYMRWNISRSIKVADCIVTDSQYTAQRINDIFNHTAKKINWIHLGVAAPSISAGLTPSKYPRISPSYVLAVGNLEPRKNIPRLIKAMKILWEDKCPIDLVLAGDFCWSKREILSLIDRVYANRIHILGYISDQELSSVYRNAFAFIFPSLDEGFGIPPLEAMAFGVPVICSNRSSIPEIVSHAGIYIENPLDEHSIAAVIKNFESNPDLRQKLIEEGYKRVKNFTWENTIEKYYTLFNQCR